VEKIKSLSPDWNLIEFTIAVIADAIPNTASRLQKCKKWKTEIIEFLLGKVWPRTGHESSEGE
jgi:hypothetical protein